MYVGRDSSVDIAARYGLDGPGIESRLGRYFPHVSKPAKGPTHTISNGSFPEGKAAGAWRCQPTPSSAEVKKRVKLYLYPLKGFRGLL